MYATCLRDAVKWDSRKYKFVAIETLALHWVVGAMDN